MFSLFIVFITSLDENNSSNGIDNTENYPNRQRRNSIPLDILDTRVDKVYTIGCFDLFHHGHITLLQRMRALGKQVRVMLTPLKKLLYNNIECNYIYSNIYFLTGKRYH